MKNQLRCISPVNNQVFVERTYADEQTVNRSLEQAVKAQQAWKKQPLTQRRDLAQRAIDLFVSQREKIAEEIAWQMGRPIESAKSEVSGVEERCRYMINIAEEALSPYFPPQKNGFECYIERKPLGVVAVIAPWNYPYLTAVNSIIPALMAGNAVILKHASQTPLCAERLHQVFLEAGFPEHVFQYLHLTHAMTDHMLRHPAMGYVHFTGSVPGGRIIQKSISDQFIGSGFELGGKDPAYVREDADLSFAVGNLVDGAFYNSGQSCCGIERIYVHQSVYDRFILEFAELTGQYRLDDPTLPTTTLGPMVKTSAADFVRKQISDAVKQGAVPLLQERHFAKSSPETPYLAPQVLVDVNHSMRVMTEESFGPVVGIMRVSSDQEAISLMNDSDLGLTASVWTEDITAAKAIGSEVQTGTFFMNRCDYLDPTLAWTGVKDTGRGVSLSRFGYDSLTRLQSFHLRTQPT